MARLDQRGASPAGDRDKRIALRKAIQNAVLERVELKRLLEMQRHEVEKDLKELAGNLLDRRNAAINRDERIKIIDEVVDNLVGLGPLEPLLADPEVSDILINGPATVFVDRAGHIKKTEVEFDDNRHLMQIVERIVVAVGRRVDEQNPMVDARMLDGSRFNAIIPPLALDGAAVSIRRFGTKEITSDDLVRFGTCPGPIMTFVKACVQCGLNTIISGGGSSGKTTLLNVMSNFIPPTERIITIEDSAELRLQIPHVVRLETRPANLEGKGAIEQRELVRNALRMRPDRIILGEVRGGEAVDMLTAMMTGLEGSMATTHSNSPRDVLARFETMVGIGMPNLTPRSIRETVARALDLVVQLNRMVDGSRKVTAITEITGLEGSVITTRDIFAFDQRTVDEHGKVRGVFYGSGTKPRLMGKLAGLGVDFPDEMWSWRMEV